jgi:hypothetical protein
VSVANLAYESYQKREDIGAKEGDEFIEVGGDMKIRRRKVKFVD